jgi:hypothetical protein
MVYAMKISEVRNPEIPKDQESDGSKILVFENNRYAQMRVGFDYVKKHNPQAGGYWVQYEDGYESFSPAAAFESGYTLI